LVERVDGLQKNSQKLNILSKVRVKFIKESLANIKDILLNVDQYKYSVFFKNIGTTAIADAVVL
jgi:hypothetical protein